MLPRPNEPGLLVQASSPGSVCWCCGPTSAFEVGAAAVSCSACGDCDGSGPARGMKQPIRRRGRRCGGGQRGETGAPHEVAPGLERLHVNAFRRVVHSADGPALRIRPREQRHRAVRRHQRPFQQSTAQIPIDDREAELLISAGEEYGLENLVSQRRRPLVQMKSRRGWRCRLWRRRRRLRGRGERIIGFAAHPCVTFFGVKSRRKSWPSV